MPAGIVPDSELGPKVLRCDWQEGDIVQAWPHRIVHVRYRNRWYLHSSGFDFVGVHDGMGGVIVSGRAMVRLA